jgi:hypothetical protein
VRTASPERTAELERWHLIYDESVLGGADEETARARADHPDATQPIILRYEHRCEDGMWFRYAITTHGTWRDPAYEVSPP